MIASLAKPWNYKNMPTQIQCVSDENEKTISSNSAIITFAIGKEDSIGCIAS